MLDAAMDGKVREALLQLDRLLASGEQPVGLLGQISASLRRFAAATRLVIQSEAAGRRVNLRDALEQTGVKPFFSKRLNANSSRSADNAVRNSIAGSCRPTWT